MLVKKYLLVLLGLFIGHLGIAQNEYPWQGRVSDSYFDEATGQVKFLRFYEEEAVTAAEFFDFIGAALRLGPKDLYEFKKDYNDMFGWKHLEFQQRHNGYPVEGAIFKAHTKNGKVLSMNGEYFSITHEPAAVMTESAALQKALQAVPATTYMWQDAAEVEALRYSTRNPNASYYPAGELVYMMNKLGSSAEEWRLCYKFDVYAQNPLSREDIYVDAENGEVIFRSNKIHTIDRPGSAHTRYSWIQDIVADSSNNEYYLRESGRGNGVETYNMLNGTSYGAAADFVDDDNFWDTLDVPMLVGGTDAHWGAEMTYDYFLQQHGRSSYDGQGALLLSYVNYGNGFANAFWDGSRMTYGGGAGNALPFSVLDVCGHEFAHGLTSNTAGLIYQDESGALNESFSDIFGVAIDHFALPNAFNWEIGEQIGGIRDMSNPGAFGDPDTYQAGLWYTGTFDNGGVHINSGVQNYWFHLLSVGGTGTNDLGNNFSVSGIGIDSAAAIAFRNLTVYLTPFNEYPDARFYAIQSAIDIFGACSPQVKSTMNAWHAVGIGGPFTNTLRADFVTYDSSHCSLPAEVSFINNSESALSYYWDFGDGNTSTDLAPTHNYTTAGTYDVTLIAYGCATGSADTLLRVGRIVIDPNQPCVLNMPINSSTTADGCTGTLYDAGGALNYPDNSVNYITISPSGASTVSLVFSAFDYAPGDYIAIYDGPDALSPLIGNFGGNVSPGTIVSTGGALTIKEVTNGFNNREGFVATWSCATSIANGLEANMRVYPSPAQSSVRVQMDLGAVESGTLEVIDAMGRVQMRRAIEGVANIDEQLNIDNFAAGVYFVRLKTASEVFTSKFTKQ